MTPAVNDRIWDDLRRPTPGRIPDIQQASLRTLGRWMARLGDVITAAQPLPQTVAQPTDDPWVRWPGDPPSTWSR
jgi:alpha-L-fucosidase